MPFAEPGLYWSSRGDPAQRHRRHSAWTIFSTTRVWRGASANLLPAITTVQSEAAEAVSSKLSLSSRKFENRPPGPTIYSSAAHWISDDRKFRISLPRSRLTSNRQSSKMEEEWSYEAWLC